MKTAIAIVIALAVLALVARWSLHLLAEELRGIGGEHGDDDRTAEDGKNERIARELEARREAPGTSNVERPTSNIERKKP